MATFDDLRNKINTLKSDLYTLAISKGVSFDGDVESLTFTKILQGMETIQVGGTGGNYSDSEVLSLEEAIAQMGGAVNKVGDIATSQEILNGILSIPNSVDGIIPTFKDSVSVRVDYLKENLLIDTIDKPNKPIDNVNVEII